MNITEFLVKMKTKYGDGVSVKLNDDKKVVSENLPQPLKEFLTITVKATVLLIENFKKRRRVHWQISGKRLLEKV